MEELNQESPLMLEEAIENELKNGHKIYLNMDPKRLRRIVSNRISAKKSRIRKAMYVSDMEYKAKELQATISVLSSIIERQKQQQAMLRMENDFIQQKLDSLSETSERHNAEIEEKTAELKRLKALQKEDENALMCGESWDAELEEIMCMSHYQSSPPPMLDFSLDPPQGI